jgi:hypothetical protein
MKKWILCSLLILLAALGGGGWWLYQSRDHLLADAIRDYGPRITGVAVKLGGVHIEPVDGIAALKGLEIGNPPGFKTPRAIELGEVSMRLDVATLTADVVRIQEVRIVAPHVTYERSDAGSNLEVIERNVQVYIAAQTGATPKQQDKAGKKKKLIIDHLYIQGAKADVSAALLQGRTLTVPISDIHLQGLGAKSGGETPAEVTEQVVNAVKNSVTKSVTMAPATGLVNGIKNGTKAAVDAVKGLFK